MKRIFFIYIIITALTIILVGYIYDMQLNSFARYNDLAQKNRIIYKPIPAQRGIIYDRNNKVLADNRPTLDVFITPKSCDSISSAIKFIDNFSPLTKNELKKLSYNLSHQQKFDTIIAKEDINDEQAALIYSNLPSMPCVSVHENMRRIYYFTPYISNVIGYITSNSIQPTGTMGVEKTFDQILQGSTGKFKYEVNANRIPTKLLAKINPKKGYDIHLTIDADLQKHIYNAFGQENGAAVAINPQNGELLAMVTHPSFDTNIFLKPISDKRFNEIIKDPNLPLLDRVTKGQFAPGSTIKPFILISALESGLINKDFNVLDNKGYYIAPNTSHVYRDWLRSDGGHGIVGIEQALAYSCDVFFYKLSMIIGMKKILPWLKGFGFGEQLIKDVPHAAKGVLSSPKWKKQNKHRPWYTGDTIMSYIGQGYMLVTPLQLANALSILVNKGNFKNTHLLKDVSADGFLLRPSIKNEQRLKISDTSLEPITRGMEAVIKPTYKWSTGWRFGKVSYSIAGKTGTAQVVHDNRKIRQQNWQKHFRDNSWFIAFSPIKKPSIAIVILVEHSSRATEIARKIMDYYRHRLHAD